MAFFASRASVFGNCKKENQVVEQRGTTLSRLMAPGRHINMVFAIAKKNTQITSSIILVARKSPILTAF